jgi:hypothetical protein
MPTGSSVYRVAARIESVTGYRGELTIEPGVVRLRVRTVFGALLCRLLGAPLVHPGPDITLVRCRWVVPWERAGLLLHKAAARAYVPLTRDKAAALSADLRAAGFDVSEVTVRAGFTGTALLESMWLRHAVDRKPFRTRLKGSPEGRGSLSR